VQAHRMKQKRRRCSECRRWFKPEVSAQSTQKICAAEPCRRSRRNQHARRRRSQDVQNYRVDERERKRRSRARRSEPERVATTAATGPSVTRCHAPALVTTTSKITGQLLLEWDKIAARSRATLEAKCAEVFERFAALTGTNTGASPALSRAGLEAQAIENIPDS
jgi:hypothetical protein